MLVVTGCGGSSSQSSNKEENTPIPPKPPAMSLIDASATGDLETIKKLIAAETDVNQLDPDEQAIKIPALVWQQHLDTRK